MNDSESSHSIEFELYYILDITPAKEIEYAYQLLQKLKESKKIDFKTYKSISDKESRELEEEIRIAATRGKFKVVSGGGAALVLSGSKKLNHLHGPILIVRRDQKVVQVYPRGEPGLKGSRISTNDFLSEALNTNTDDFFDIDLKTFTEQDLRNLVIRRPSLIEENLTFVDVEVNIDSAIIDLVFIDAENNHLLLEFKLNAEDKTIGQVTRYNLDSYAKLMKIPKNKIRKGIVTLGFTGQIQEACKSNNIELYVLKFENIGFSN